MVPLLLTGPAGSGKTHRCLAEIAEFLRDEPEGPPLLLLAPRQATYQLERQVLSFEGILGFTRLRIVSFQRLAQFIFQATGRVEPKLLSEQGRVMVLRAILGRRRNSLRVFGAAAGKEGLAQELSDLWRELREHEIGPPGLLRAAERIENPKLAAKLGDFAEIFGEYAKWLDTNNLRDGDELLDLAAEAALRGPMPKIGGLWLDGFAQMTPQERRLLEAALPHCARATLAFCLPERPLKECDGFSMWGVLTRTYCALRDELKGIFGVAPREEVLQRRDRDGRFCLAPELARIEQAWGAASEMRMADGRWRTEGGKRSVRVVKCANLEAEAVMVAQEILRFVRAGGRFREAAVLVRSLDGAHDLIERVFRRYGIPFFMDKREAVAHHPLAELTRGTLRAIALNFRQREVFCALKSGLSGIADRKLDWFENLALSRGWHGADWRGKLRFGKKTKPWEMDNAEAIRKAAMRPIFQLEERLGTRPSGIELAAGLQDFWSDLDVEAQLEKWAGEAREPLHETVWNQMCEWVESIERAFGDERMSLLEWLGVVEAGLGSLTVGLIPPSLDQTLVGAVDRSRNPDLRAVFLMGVNEGMFPKRGRERLLLNDTDREALAEAGCALGITSVWNVGAEQFYGYIACTRGREFLTISFAETDASGERLNPSVFVGQLQRLLPGLEVETSADADWREAQALCEMSQVIFGAALREAKEAEIAPVERELMRWRELKPMWERARASAIVHFQKLRAETVAGLYGKRLATSVSRLEQFAMCPFRFFVSSGLKAEERLEFELDRREEGSFQHEILAEFHRRVEASGRKWREVPAKEGRELIAEIASRLHADFADGLVAATAGNRFKARAKVAALQEFMGAYLELMRECDFDPARVELGFGPKGPLPVWELRLKQERALEFSGRVDRVDVLIDGNVCYAVVYDYKSNGKTLDRKLVEHAIQQQLPAYLVALEKCGGKEFGHRVKAAGAFYVNLNPGVKKAKSRAEASMGNWMEEDLRQGGMFDWELIGKLDSKGERKLFDYAKTGPKADGFKAMAREEFEKLLRETEKRLRDLGQRIFDGDAAMDPYEKGKQRACATCFYAGICRIDPWTHQYRNLDP